MTLRSVSRTLRKARRLPPDEMDRWLRVVHALPAVRTQRIAGIREALRHDSYETEHILAATVARVTEVLGLGETNTLA